MNNKEFYTFDELIIGQEAHIDVNLTQEYITRLAELSGDHNPVHLDKAYAKKRGFHDTIAHGACSGILISAVLGTRLPGPGTIYLSQTLKFKRPVFSGDCIRAIVSVTAKDEKRKVVTFSCKCVNQEGITTTFGEAEVIPPAAA